MSGCFKRVRERVTVGHAASRRLPEEIIAAHSKLILNILDLFAASSHWSAALDMYISLLFYGLKVLALSSSFGGDGYHPKIFSL